MSAAEWTVREPDADAPRLVEVPKPKRIALIGSAPSSIHLAPYGDPSWTIWGCSPGAALHVKRVDAWFEMHPATDDSFTPDYVEWLRRLGKPVYVSDQLPVIEPSQACACPSVIYPRQQMVEKYGRYFFTSSLSWMFALALEQNPDEIGLWGVDMSATEEYGYQRAGCHYFITIAQSRGIKISVPYESDLLQPPVQYGCGTATPMYRKLKTRRDELVKRRDAAAANYEAARNEWNFLNGAIDDLNYMLNTWVG